MSDVWTEIPDLAEASWTILEHLPDSLLAASLRRIRADAENAVARLSAFNSALD